MIIDCVLNEQEREWSEAVSKRAHQFGYTLARLYRQDDGQICISLEDIILSETDDDS